MARLGDTAVKLESLLGQFIVNTDVALRRLEASLEAFKEEMNNKVIINETKSTPKMEYINDFVNVLKEIEDYFPEYKGKEIIPIFLSLYLSDEIVKYLTKKKIYAMALKDGTMDLLNFEKINKEF